MDEGMPATDAIRRFWQSDPGDESDHDGEAEKLIRDESIRVPRSLDSAKAV